ncbi:hypothetical protein [Pseudophaeobacter sp.]|uniref:hypothetical protein n=1 Tax=Pseudophaeobacter sp. TaxID=1971739 RepID=UPI003A984A11
MDYHVKNGSHVAKAFKVRGGHTVVPAGKKADLVDAKELTEEEIEAFEHEGVKVKAIGAASGKQDLTGPFEVADKGRGWFVVKRGDLEVTKSLRKEDVEGFSELSEEDQAAFIDLHRAE